MFTLPDLPPAFWIVAMVAALFIGLAKGGFGSGPALLSTPLLGLFMSISEAAGLLLPLLILTDIFTTRHYFHDIDRPSLRVILPASVAGIALGGIFFNLFQSNERVMQAGIGLIALAFVLYQAARALIPGMLQLQRPPPWAGWLLSMLGGFTSTLAHAGGPPITIYLLPQGLSRAAFVGTLIGAFLFINLVKLIPYSLLGLLNVGNLLVVLLLVPFSLLGVRIGVLLNRKFNDLWFNRLIYTLLFLTGLQLVLGRSLVGLAL